MKAFVEHAGYAAAPVGHRFLMTYQPDGRSIQRGTLVVLPPFAEEMNKSRRAMAVGARALAADGWRVVQCDLLGCGDSFGDFGDATWTAWIDDLRRLLTDERAHAKGPLWLWAVRAGALLVAPLLRERLATNLLLWQPVTAGAQYLSQFLRLKAAGKVVGHTGAQDRNELVAQLEQSQSVEVAGYLLHPQLALPLKAARLELPPDFQGRVVWLEASSDPEPQLSLAAQRLIKAWSETNINIRAEALGDAMFWQTQEIAEAPELLRRTLRFLAD
jgi:exosortase A-associated hydrolase 2